MLETGWLAQKVRFLTRILLLYGFTVATMIHVHGCNVRCKRLARLTKGASNEKGL